MMKVFLPVLLLQESITVWAMMQAKPPDHTGGWPDGYNPIIGQLVLLVTTLAGFAYQMWAQREKNRIEERNRQWDLEDRERARKELASQTKAAAAELADHTEHTFEARTKEIVEKIEENTQISREAFAEANDINRKILAISRRFTEGSPNEKLEQIDETTQDTQAKVTEIKEQLDAADAADGEKPS